jgi:hypothetical protein
MEDTMKLHAAVLEGNENEIKSIVAASPATINSLDHHQWY